ncbi:MAG: Asp-tRNA(Asn)/Glu-tRNA(Gln) amidotransferase subunit GatC [Desulfovibrionaceae bacterium]|nr:Asp-tRNA(Asn)/Glu-tRNA(Gln) amidotransferase subunit GatC [Desulfovibrionaceae bacterium]
MSETKTIGPGEVRHMAQLSRLSVSQEEESLFAAQFASILGYMDVLNDVAVEGVNPLYSPCDHDFVPREDHACHTRTHEEILANAPQSDSSSFVVPRIV